MYVGSLVGERVGGKQPTRLKVTLSIKKLKSPVAGVTSSNCTTIVEVAAGVLIE